MMYGNASNGYGYSPDRSRDVDRFNHSTRSNYPTSYNTKGYGCHNPYMNSAPKTKGYYDGRGQYHAE